MKTFAVVVPVFNGEEFLNDCILSIMNQFRIPDEIIIVDDGSTDNTINLIKRWTEIDSNVKTVSTSNRGVSAARNLGATLATTDYIFFLDVDDRWLPEKVSEHESHIVTHPECAFSFSLSEIFDYDRKKVLSVDSAQTKDSDLFNILTHEFQILGSSSSVCLKRDLFALSGGFNNEISRGEDWELWVRFSEISKPCQIEKVLVSICLRENSVEQSRLRGIKNFYSTSVHLKVWNKYITYLKRDEFSKLAVRILFADIWKNRSNLFRVWHQYNKLITKEVELVQPLLRLRWKKPSMISIILTYLENRMRND